ncbi:MAG: monovalent cation/H+ antiporter subunit D family protein [Firmicutes bacterium]|nr:monovalent cation/H+ antiporter subunit D family protein [Bacillota bacterium]
MIHLPLMLVVFYLAMAFITPLLGRLKKFSSRYFGVAVSAAGLLIVGATAFHVFDAGPFRYFPGNWASPVGIEIVVDEITVLLQLTIAVIGFLVSVYSVDDLDREIDERMHNWFYVIYFLMMAALNGLVMSFDLFNIFVFTEIGTLTACAMVAIKSKRVCLRAAINYLILSTLGSGMILMGIALIYMVTGHLNIGAVAQVLPEATEAFTWNVRIALSLFVVGFGIKSALFPLHLWLPDAHSSAPTPSSALLSGVVLKVFIVVIGRIVFQMFGVELFVQIPIPLVILTLATMGIFLGSLFAITQTDIKRMLAYSSVAQVGYIFMGIALVSARGATGGLLHIFNHAVMKSLLFTAAGAIIYKTGIRKIDDLNGIGYKMPLTMAAFGVGALSMVGIPGTSGFFSKLWLALGALDAGQPFFVLVIIISSLLNSVYYLPIIVRAFFGGGSGKFTMDQLPWKMLLPLVILAAINLYFGILPGSLVRLAEQAAAIWLH